MICTANWRMPMYSRKQFWAGHDLRHKPAAFGGFMRRFNLRTVPSSVLVAIVGLSLTANAQTKKPSVWDKIKQAAQQGQQQGQQQAGQPQQQPGQKPPRPGQQQSAGGTLNDSGPFKP